MSVNTPRLQIHDILQFLNRQRFNFLIGHRRHGARKAHVDNRPLSNDHDFSGCRSCFLKFGVNLCSPVCGDRDPGHGISAIPDQAELNVIASGGDVDDIVISIHVRRGAERRADDDDIHAYKSLLGGLVDDASGNLPGCSGKTGAREHDKRKSNRRSSAAVLDSSHGIVRSVRIRSVCTVHQKNKQRRALPDSPPLYSHYFRRIILPLNEARSTCEPGEDIRTWYGYTPELNARASNVPEASPGPCIRSAFWPTIWPSMLNTSIVTSLTSGSMYLIVVEGLNGFG